LGGSGVRGFRGSGDVDSWVLVPDELDVLGRKVLAHYRPPVMAGGIMPFLSNHCHAGLLAQPSLRGESIRLWPPLAPRAVPLVHPDHPHPVRVQPHRPVGGQHLHQGGGPEPAIDVEGLVVVCLAPRHLGIAEAARGPDLLDSSSRHEALHDAPLLGGLEGHQVHAALPAVVPGGEPVPAPLPQHLLVALPAEPVGFVLEGRGADLRFPYSTFLGLWEADLPPVTVRVDVSP